MKMENANVRFASFDAQDVITTSVSWKGVNMAAKMSLLDEYNDTFGATFYSKQSQRWLIADDDTAHEGFYKANSFFGYSYEKATQTPVYSDSASSSTLPANYVEAKYLSDISLWFQHNQ